VVVGPAVTISVTSVMRVYRERIPVNRTCSIISSLPPHRDVANTRRTRSKQQAASNTEQRRCDSRCQKTTVLTVRVGTVAMATFTFECQCCFEDVDASEEVECTGRVPHSFCVACVRTQVELDVTNGKSETPCVMTRACDGVYSRSTRYRVLSEVSRRRADREEVTKEVEAAGLEGFWRCPFCDFGAVCELIEGEREFWCRNEQCLRTSCRCCRREAHPGVDCDDTTEVVELPVGTVVCPSCGRMVCRDGGCNMIHCVCGTNVCAMCGEGIPYRISYSHFGWEPKCLLYSSAAEV